ncbi:MAG TPA: YeeE/YedE thiosulfate transporter family protein [Anaerolineae bacterium]|nr:YeeE/YedE thiosulfate transporter family protein [Anaerolineae bacterium]HMR64334.1 YeeE/YedE thiosulfate transporter family protein [Anaerolineae bacterium]
MEWILQPWPWYVSGPLIGLMVPALLLLTGKTFGVSTSFQHIGAMCSPKTKLPYLKNYNWRQENWRLVLVVGIALGGFIGVNLLSAAPAQFLPDSYYSWGGVLQLIIGGLLVGFGVRYADGCTSGHTIMGLSNLQWSSLVASISFFAGGLLMVHVLLG